MDQFALGYAMGLIVGEGSFTGDRQQASLEVKLHRRDPEPLEHLRSLFGGKIYGPYARQGRTLYAYMLRGRALKDAIPILERFLPRSWKRVQFDAWRVKYSHVLEKPEPSQALVERVQRHLPPQY